MNEAHEMTTGATHVGGQALLLLRERLELANRRLEVMAEQNTDHDEVLRISGKAEGVSLALSYLRDQLAFDAEPAASSPGVEK